MCRHLRTLRSFRWKAHSLLLDIPVFIQDHFNVLFFSWNIILLIQKNTIQFIVFITKLSREFRKQNRFFFSSGECNMLPVTYLFAISNFCQIHFTWECVDKLNAIPGFCFSRALHRPALLRLSNPFCLFCVLRGHIIDTPYHVFATPARCSPEERNTEIIQDEEESVTYSLDEGKNHRESMSKMANDTYSWVYSFILSVLFQFSAQLTRPPLLRVYLYQLLIFLAPHFTVQQITDQHPQTFSPEDY